MDEFKLKGNTLKSVNKEVDPEEERLYANLYAELEETDRRVSRTRQKGKANARGFPVGTRGAIVRRESPPNPCLPQTYARRRGSTSTSPALELEEHHEIRLPEYDSDGALLSEGDFIFTSETDEDECASDDVVASDHASDDDSFTLSP